MGILATKCPHCLVENSAFESVGEVLLGLKGSGVLYTVLFLCRGCQKGLGGTVWWDRKGGSPHSYQRSLNSSPNHTIVETYPAPPPLEAPEHLPDDLRNLYLQALGAHRMRLPVGNGEYVSGHTTAAMACRKILEIAVRRLDPEAGEGFTLYQRIERLAATNRITKELRDWAHEIRLSGNEAVHDDVLVSEETAADLLAFTEIFLLYTFTLPNMLAQRRRAASGTA